MRAASELQASQAHPLTLLHSACELKDVQRPQQHAKQIQERYAAPLWSQLAELLRKAT